MLFFCLFFVYPKFQRQESTLLHHRLIKLGAEKQLLCLTWTACCSINKHKVKEWKQTSGLFMLCLEQREQAVRETFPRISSWKWRHLNKFSPYTSVQNLWCSETVCAELSLSQVCTERASTECTGDTGGAQGAPEVSHSKWRENKGGGVGGGKNAEKDVITSISSSMLVWRELQKTDDLHFHTHKLQQQSLPGFRKARVRKVWKDKEMGKSEVVWSR